MGNWNLTKIGIIVLVVSIVVGLLGPAWGIYQAFDALEMNESAGIGSVGASIYGALIFSIVGIIGSLAGLVLVIVGIVQTRQTK